MTTTIKEKKIEDLANLTYKYGFSTKIESNSFPPGLSTQSIKLLSFLKNEPKKMLTFRLKAYKKWKTMRFPTWCPLNLQSIDYHQIVFYSAPVFKQTLDNVEQIHPEFDTTMTKLGFSFDEERKTSKVVTDIIFDSESIATSFSGELHKAGVILCSISEGLQKYFPLIEKNLGRAVPYADNFFAALNSAVFTDGSFVYIPKNVKCPLEIGTYFRVNNKQSGQFERTLIVAEDGSYVSYLEGCTAPEYATHQFHAAVVELIALKNAEIKYSTIQNWYSGDRNGNGGLFNFVTKRGICAKENAKISWTQIETGSAATWKYPSCVLVGNNSIGEFFSVAITNNYQQTDSGSKMFHLGTNTKSQIISKGMSFGRSLNTYRGLIKIGRLADNSRNFSQCDSVIFGNSQSNTFPSIEVQNSTARVEHEATASKVAEEQIFYLMQRGLSMEEAISIILYGFCQTVFEQLPSEFASEVDYLLTTKLEGSVG